MEPLAEQLFLPFFHFEHTIYECECILTKTLSNGTVLLACKLHVPRLKTLIAVASS